MLVDFFRKLVEIYNINEFKVAFSSNKDKLLRLYLFYHYFNADEIQIDDLEECILNHQYIDSIHEINDSDNHSIDLVKVIEISEIEHLFESIKVILLKSDLFFAELFSGYKSSEHNTVRKLFLDLDVTEEKSINFTFLSDLHPAPIQKSLIKEFVTNFKSKLSTISYRVFFADDIHEIVSDIEAPSLCVKQGVLFLTDKNEYMYHGNEKSIVTSISAKSIKEIYIKYSTNGLFTSNLRFYVKSARIDSNIKNSIIHEPERFWYYNNGLIITCDDYRLSDGRVELTNFSIVNGGQTTNLIGNTQFDNDFSVLCKIIKNKYKDNDENTVFLSKVAETSNTQKPIKSRDLIANRIEQIKLKKTMNSVGVYVQIKRGERINKELYPEKWQNATNDEIGQMLFSSIYQHPGIARNSKSKMLENESYYNTIYRSYYNPLFILSLQHLKVGFNKWCLSIKRKNNDSNKLGLSKNGFFLFLAIFGYIIKIYYNSDLLNIIENYKNHKDPSEDPDIKKALSQNDIGELRLFMNPDLISDFVRSEALFEFIYKHIMLPAYIEFKNTYPSSAYSNFTKNDTNYYRSVLPVLINFTKNSWTKGPTLRRFFDNYFEPNNSIEISLIDEKEIFEDYKPGLSQELSEYRKTKFLQYQGKMQAYEIFTNHQRSKIVHFKPKSLKELKIDCKMSDYSIQNFGEEILKIVQKYLLI